MVLETQFLDEFKKNEKDYFKFYRKHVKNINIFLLYSNIKNELVYVKKYKKIIKDSKFDESEFFSVVKNRNFLNNKKYIFDSCNQYNFNLVPENVENFLNSDTIHNYYFMNTYSSIENIEFDDTIEFFSDLNSLYFLFKEEPSSNNKTRRVYINTNKKTRKNRNPLNLLTMLN